MDRTFSDEIVLEDAPEISGLTFRHFRGESDYAKMKAVIDGSKDVDGIERTDTVEIIANLYSHLVNCDPFQDMLFAELESQVIAYNRIFWLAEQGGALIYTFFGYLLPQWRRQRIGTAMLRWAERRARTIASGQPGSRERFTQSFAAETQAGTIALLEKEGYTPVRHFYRMLRPDLDNLVNVPLPSGLEVRPVEMKDLPAINLASREAFRDHWGYSEDGEPTVQEWLADPNFDPSLWRVAWDGDQVAGMVLSYINQQENEEYHQKRGWTENICVRRPWRGRGLARALLYRSLEALKARGMTEAALGVDTQNLSGALKLYESVGFRSYQRSSNYRKSLILN